MEIDDIFYLACYNVPEFLKFIKCKFENSPIEPEPEPYNSPLPLSPRPWLLEYAPELLAQALTRIDDAKEALAMTRAILGIRGLDRKKVVNCKLQSRRRAKTRMELKWHWIPGTPLRCAKHVEVVRELLKNKADPNMKTGFRNETILQHFCALGEDEIVGLLLSRGAKADLVCIKATSGALDDANETCHTYGKGNFGSVFQHLRVALSPGEWRKSGAIEDYNIEHYAPQPHLLFQITEQTVGLESPLWNSVPQPLPPEFTAEDRIFKTIYAYSLPYFVVVQWESYWGCVACHRKTCILPLTHFAMLKRLAQIAFFVTTFACSACACSRWDMYLCACPSFSPPNASASAAVHSGFKHHSHIRELIDHSVVVGNFPFAEDVDQRAPHGLRPMLRKWQLEPPGYLHFFVRKFLARYLAMNPRMRKWQIGVEDLISRTSLGLVRLDEEGEQCDQVLYFLEALEHYFMNIKKAK